MHRCNTEGLMLKAMTITALVLTLTAAVVIAAFMGLGADRFWRLFGEPDLGPVSFETLKRRSGPNDALACPPGVCQAASDVTTGIYAAPASQLRQVFKQVIASEPAIDIVETSDATLTDRYIQRSSVLGFPDTVVVRFMDRPDGRSTLAMYSRSQLGRSDLGANRARIDRWLTKLASLSPPAT